jgi:hypothetical protein
MDPPNSSLLSSLDFQGPNFVLNLHVPLKDTPDEEEIEISECCKGSLSLKRGKF